jgi:nucleotide-binding universal stress UspA family protein
MKSILVPVLQEDCGPALALATAVAKHFDGIVQGVALQAPPVPGVDWGMGSTFVVQEPRADDERVAEEAYEQFRAAMARHDMPIVPDLAGRSGPCAIWSEGRPIANHMLGRLGRAFALTCVPQPTGRPAVVAAFETALFDSGGPIVFVPQDCPIRVDGCAGLVWNGSDETARTLKFALPLFRRAERVVIIADEKGQFAFPSGQQILQELCLEGVKADLRLLPEGSVPHGKPILSAAEDEGCDLLVKGAYTQSRIRQIIFGGATQYILSNARMPVFMAH